jgi:hypothetical protein
MEEALLGGVIAGLALGNCLGAFAKPRMKPRDLWSLGMFSVLFGAVIVYFPLYYFVDFLFKAEDANGSMKGEALVAALIGYLIFVGAKLLEDRALIRRLKTRGRLLLTEYRGFDGAQLVSEWRDPETHQVHMFHGAVRGDDPAKFVRTAIIAVFVNPGDFTDYYMDLSFHHAGTTRRAPATP